MSNSSPKVTLLLPRKYSRRPGTLDRLTCLQFLSAMSVLIIDLKLSAASVSLDWANACAKASAGHTTVGRVAIVRI